MKIIMEKKILCISGSHAEFQTLVFSHKIITCKYGFKLPKRQVFEIKYKKKLRFLSAMICPNIFNIRDADSSVILFFPQLVLNVLIGCLARRSALELIPLEPFRCGAPQSRIDYPG